MRKSVPLTLGAVILVGAVAGHQLGMTSAEQIDPSYFRGPAVHPRDRGVEVAERIEAEPLRPAAFAAASDWDAARAARDADCGDPCEEGAAARDTDVDALIATGERWLAEAAPAPRDSGVRVHRYGSRGDEDWLVDRYDGEGRAQRRRDIERYAYQEEYRSGGRERFAEERERDRRDRRQRDAWRDRDSYYGYEE